jgi:hypothetical protein
MRKYVLLLSSVFLFQLCLAQTSAYKRLNLFEKEDPLQLSVKTDMKNLIGKKVKGAELYSSITWKYGDSVINSNVNLSARGNFRRQECYIPPLKFDFDTSTAPQFKGLGGLDLTCQCKSGASFVQLVYKEYMVYKIYNIITDKSQRAQLVNLDVEDVEAKKKPATVPGFFIEDLDVTAKRNNCMKVKLEKLHTENTDRKQMTLVAMFEYMIGNTDWSVYANHNIKLILDTTVANSKPYAVAYDFDFAGLVNAPYAIPDPMLGTETVLIRVYRGFPRELGELREMADHFTSKKDQIYAAINGSTVLDSRSKKEMISYLDDFFNMIKDDRRLKTEFIDNARTM